MSGSTVIIAMSYRNAPEAIGWLCRVFGFENPPLSKHLDEIGGAETRGVNLVVDDADEIYARAKAAGAEILSGIEAKPYSGRAFTCRDLERRIWNIGTYDPWQAKSGEAE